MDLPTLQEFESELISQGYSRSYARRFADELLDHSLELDQEQSDSPQITEPGSNRIPQQVGTVQALSDAVNSYQELDPLPRKFPFACFVFLPAIILNLWICFALYWIYELANSGQQAQRVFAVNFTNTIYWLFLAAFPIVAMWASKRYRVSKWYVGLLTLGLATSSLFGTTVATCDNSQSSFIHSDWGFRWWQFLIPIAALVASHVTLSWKGRDRFALSTISRRRNADPVWLAITGISLVVVIAMSGYLISGSIESLRKHPVDTLVSGFNAPVSKARRYLGVLQSSENPLQTPIREQIEERIERYKSELKELYSKLDTSDQKSWKQVNAASNELANSAYQEISGKLTSEQSEQIDRIGLGQQGWLAIFDPTLRRELDVSAYQFSRFKDIHLSSIKENQRLNKQWRNASDEDKPAVVEKVKAFRSQTDADYAAILSSKQLKMMDQSYGTEYYEKYYGQELPIVQSR